MCSADIRSNIFHEFRLFLVRLSIQIKQCSFERSHIRPASQFKNIDASVPAASSTSNMSHIVFVCFQCYMCFFSALRVAH